MNVLSAFSFSCKPPSIVIISVNLFTISVLIRFSYSLSCRLKIVQSLRHFEHLAPAMAEAVESET